MSIVASHLIAILLVLSRCDARSTRVSAQYSVSDGGEELTRTFGTRGIVEDAVIEDGGIITKLNTRATRNSPRGQKKRRPTSNPSADYEQLPFQPEFFALKGKVLDDDEPIPSKQKGKARPRVRTHTTQSGVQLKPITQSVSTKNPFKFPAIQNEQIFESKLQEAPSYVTAKKYKLPSDGNQGESVYTYSTIKFSGDDDDESYSGKPKSKIPKRSTSINSPQLFNLEQTFGGTEIKFDSDIADNAQFHESDGFKPSGKFPSTTKGQKLPAKLFKSTEDGFKDSEFFDFSIRPRPGAISSNGPTGNFGKLKSDLGVKGIPIKHKNKFDPQIHTGFKPSFKLRDFPKLHGADVGSGIASNGQIQSFFQREERNEKIKHNSSNDSSKPQLQQFFKAKEDKRLERLVEEQFKLQEQKQLAQEKEAELKHQQQVLQRQKEKLKQVEKQLSNKVTRQTAAARQKRRPNSSNAPRRQRNPNLSGHSTIPVRSVTSKDGPYRVSFNVQ